MAYCWFYCVHVWGFVCWKQKLMNCLSCVPVPVHFSLPLSYYSDRVIYDKIAVMEKLMRTWSNTGNWGQRATLWYKAYQYLNALHVCEREWALCVLMRCSVKRKSQVTCSDKITLNIVHCIQVWGERHSVRYVSRNVKLIFLLIFIFLCVFWAV